MKRPKKHIPLSLSPLSFDEAVSDILKVKPESKSAKKNRVAMKRGKNNVSRARTYQPQDP